MKVLIMSVTAGQGHNVTAKAVADYLKSMGAEARVFDTLEYINRFLGRTVDKSYLASIKNAKSLYKNFYRVGEKRKAHDPEAHTFIRVFGAALSIKLLKYIEYYKPDAIVCTHVIAAMLMDILKQKKATPVPVYGILTDFACHPLWEETQCIERVVVQSDLLIPQIQRKGLDPARMLPTGIPIDPKFALRGDKTAARLALGLDPAIETVLVMGGSMGYGDMESMVKTIDLLEKEIQVIAVCGSNAALKARIDRLKTHCKLVSLGYAGNVDELMDASDCIITKPGGLTSSEALAKGLPMVIVNPIPGQEDRNREFLVNNGVAVAVSETYPLDEALFQLFRYPERIENMRRSAALLSRPNSTRDLCEFIESEYRKAGGEG